MDAALMAVIAFTGVSMWTLREAVQASEANPGPDEIVLPADAVIQLDWLAADPCGPGDGGVGDLDITQPLTVHGGGATVDASQLPRGDAGSRVLQVELPADRPDGDVRLEDLTLQGGDVAQDIGGVVRVVDRAPEPPGRIVLEQVIVRDGVASNGGGVFTNGADVHLDGSRSLTTRQRWPAGACACSVATERVSPVAVDEARAAARELHDVRTTTRWAVDVVRRYGART